MKCTGPPQVTALSRVPPRGGVRPVTCTEPHIKRSLRAHQRCFYVPCVSLAPGASIYKRRVARVRRSPTPAALQVTLSTARQPRRHVKAMRRALSALLSASSAATCGFGASSKMSSSVQQPPNYEARRCMLLRRMTRAHKIRRHRMHAMLWDELRKGLAALREWL